MAGWEIPEHKREVSFAGKIIELNERFSRNPALSTGG
jgi:hypothetical protein